MTINRFLLFIFPSKMHCTLPPTKGGKCEKFERHKSVEGSKVPKSAVIMYCMSERSWEGVKRPKITVILYVWPLLRFDHE